MRLFSEGLSVHRGDQEIFAGISFEAGDGEAVVITGPNGAGKSTLLKTIAGFLKPAAGRIGLDGRGERTIGQCCHYLGHENALKPALTVAENLSFWKNFLSVVEFGSGTEIGEALESVGLGGMGSLPAAYLSAGQKRRVAIARLLVCDRPVWLLDEPTAALDAASRERFAEIAGQFVSRGGILIAATHQALGIGTEKSLVLQSVRRGASH